MPAGAGRPARRVVVTACGPPGVLEVVGCLVPEPGPGEVLVEVAAAGVNFVDLHQRSGAYRVRPPWTPGIEGAGVVRRVGTGVSEFGPGDRVGWAGVPGGYASHCVVPADRLFPVPAAVGLADAAALLIQGMTAHALATDVVRLDDPAVCLVHAAAGGVGGLLCQLAVLRGAAVIGTASGAGKRTAARANGARHVVDYGRGGFAEQVRELTGGGGVDVVFDAVGRDTFAQSLACLRPRGTLVLYGQISGAVEPFDPQLLNARGSLYLTKPSLSHYDTTPAQRLARAGAVFDLFQTGRLRPRVHRYRLEEAAAVHAAIEARQVTGKVLLIP